MVEMEILRDFVMACGESGKVTIRYDAERDARSDFSFQEKIENGVLLNTKNQILTFIEEGGLESPKFIKKGIWRNAPPKYVGSLNYVFYFVSGDKHGYLAFIRIEQEDRWQIKSFKENKLPHPKTIADEKQLNALKARFQIEGKKK